MDKDKRQWKLPNGRDWLWGNLGLVLMSGAMFSKSFIQFSVDGWGYVPSLRPNYGRDNDTTVSHCQPTPMPEIPGHSQASLSQSLVGISVPFS